MRVLRALSVVGVGLVVGLTGCLSTTRAVQKTQAPPSYQTATVEQLKDWMATSDAAVKTLNAQVLVTASTGGSKEGEVKEYTSFKGYIFVQKPQQMRLILQLPFIGSRAMDMVSDGKEFTLMMASKTGDKWLQGSDEVVTPSKNGLENLRPAVVLDSLLIPAVRPDEYVALTESTRVLDSQVKRKVAIEEPVYELAIARLKNDHVLERERVVKFSRVTLLPYEQDLFDSQGRVVTVATYDNYQEYQGQKLPATITIRRPLEEYGLKINVTKLVINETFEADQFELKVPEGVTVKRLP